LKRPIGTSSKAAKEFLKAFLKEKRNGVTTLQSALLTAPLAQGSLIY